ncbi:FecCD family ABC transporter permease [Demetria terragena]|uniref:FecCD family ABC transporter permease n=1 Tax=Demetria terragena TaxID=63959 RepID=UPI0003797E4D|nr:iron ABC transporter permease [Demetria terragena]
MSALTKQAVPAVRLGPVSWRVNLRAAVVAVGASAALVLAVCLGIAHGDPELSLSEVIRSLTGRGTMATDLVVYELRLPQTAVAVLSGAALGLSGALVQTLARNPLASPDVIGVNAGAAVGAVGFLILVAGQTGEVGTDLMARIGLPASALVGGLLTGMLLLSLSGRGGADSQRLILLGIGVSAALTAVTSYLIVTARLESAVHAQLWLTGSLNNRGWVEATPIVLALVVGVPTALLLRPTLHAIALGGDTAKGLGVRLDRAQTVLLLGAVLLAATAVAGVGPLGFVAFVAPQLARRIAHTATPPLVSSLLVGSTLVVIADLVSRVLLPTPLAAGIVTSLIGAPYFIFLLLRYNRKRSV